MRRLRLTRRPYPLIAVVVGVIVPVSLLTSVGAESPPFGREAQAQRGGILASDQALPPSRRPARGGRRALLHAGGEGSRGWDFLAYRSIPPRFGQRFRPFCQALARSDAKAVPRGGIPGPVDPADVWGMSVVCEYPPTLAARLLRKRFETRTGGVHPEAGPTTTPYYGLALGGVRRITLRKAGQRTVAARLSRPFRFEIPRFPLRVRRQIENRRQMRLTAGLPRSIAVRAYLGVVPAHETPVGEPTPVVTIRARFRDGRVVTRRSGGRLVRPEPEYVPLEPRPGGPVARLSGVGSDAVSWEAIGFETLDRSICTGATKAPWKPHKGSLSCGGGLGAVEPLVRQGIRADLGTDLPDGRRPTGSYTIYGLARAKVTRIVFTKRGVEPVRAQLSPVWTTARWRRGELRSIANPRYRRRVERLPRAVGVRLFLAVVPAGVHGLRPRVTLRDGRVLRPWR
jgi:hypothetical protein